MDSLAVARPVSFEYVDEGGGIDEQLLCSVCSDPLFQPVMHQTCGNLACEACIGNLPHCPICRTPTKDALLDVPRLIKTRVNALLVVCPQCRVEKVPRSNLDAHLMRCPAAGRNGVGTPPSSAAMAEQKGPAYGLFSHSPAFFLGGEEMSSGPVKKRASQTAIAERRATTGLAPAAASEHKGIGGLEGELLARLGAGAFDEANLLDENGSEDGDDGAGEAGQETVVMNTRMLKQMEKRMLSTAMSAIAKILSEKQGSGSVDAALSALVPLADAPLDPAQVYRFVHALPLCSAKRLAEPRTLWDELWGAVRTAEFTNNMPQRQLRVFAAYFSLPDHLQTVRSWWKAYTAAKPLVFDLATVASIEDLREAFFAAVAKHRLPTRDLFKRLLNYRYHLQDNFVEFHANWTRQLSEIETRLGFPPRGFARLGHLLFARGLTEDSRVVECLMPLLADMEFIDPWDERTVQAISTVLIAAKSARQAASAAKAAAQPKQQTPAPSASQQKSNDGAQAEEVPLKERRFCFKCKQSGHVVKNCPENGPIAQTNGSTAPAAPPQAPVVATTTAPVEKEEKKERETHEKCYRCGERGHKRKDCKQLQASNKEREEREKEEARQKELEREREAERIAKERAEKERAEKERAEKERAAKAAAKSNGASPADASEAKPGRLPPLRQKCFKCGQYGHLQKSCVVGIDPEKLTCFRCEAKGHVARDCPKEVEVDRSHYKCFKCGKQGHLHKSCPTVEKSDKAEKATVKIDEKPE